MRLIEQEVKQLRGEGCWLVKYVSNINFEEDKPVAEFDIIDRVLNSGDLKPLEFCRMPHFSLGNRYSGHLRSILEVRSLERDELDYVNHRDWLVFEITTSVNNISKLTSLMDNKFSFVIKDLEELSLIDIYKSNFHCYDYLQSIKKYYYELLEEGMSKEDAQSYLPLSLAKKIYVGGFKDDWMKYVINTSHRTNDTYMKELLNMISKKIYSL